MLGTAVHTIDARFLAHTRMPDNGQRGISGNGYTPPRQSRKLSGPVSQRSQAPDSRFAPSPLENPGQATRQFGATINSLLKRVWLRGFDGSVAVINSEFVQPLRVNLQPAQEIVPVVRGG